MALSPARAQPRSPQSWEDGLEAAVQLARAAGSHDEATLSLDKVRDVQARAGELSPEQVCEALMGVSLDDSPTQEDRRGPQESVYHAGSQVACADCFVGSEAPPHECEVRALAEHLGIDWSREPDLHWVAREALLERIYATQEWNPHWTHEGKLYYFNTATKKGVWDVWQTWEGQEDHCEHYRRQVDRYRLRQQRHSHADGKQPAEPELQPEPQPEPEVQQQPRPQPEPEPEPEPAPV